jgi:hypothetical protein
MLTPEAVNKVLQLQRMPSTARQPSLLEGLETAMAHIQRAPPGEVGRQSAHFTLAAAWSCVGMGGIKGMASRAAQCGQVALTRSVPGSPAQYLPTCASC